MIERKSGDGGNRTHGKFLPRRAVGWVYFIRDLAADPVEIKIGRTINLDGRYRQLERQHPERNLRLASYFTGAREHESALHRRFAEGALGHEWFRADTPGLEDFISDADQFDAFFWPDLEAGWVGEWPGMVSGFSERMLAFYAEVAT